MDLQKLQVDCMAFLKSRVFHRMATVTLAFMLSVGFIVASTRLATNADIIPKVLSNLMPRIPACDIPTPETADKKWLEYKKKYEHLDDTKFTIAIQTYQRPQELNNTLHALTDEKVPSLKEIVVVWNDLEEKPPADWVGKAGTPIRYRQSEKNSLNQRLLPDSSFTTQAVLLSDDDVFYHTKDLEFTFQVWRRYGRDRLTGALARCSEVDEHGNWNYAFCNNKGAAHYSMVLTNLAFSHMSFLEYYSSDLTLPTAIRKYVDEHFNCEDIAMNYVHSYLTGVGPLNVNGLEKYVNYVPKKGISTRPGHLQNRSKCLNDFAKMFSCMPLINEEAHVQRGVAFSD